MLVVWVSVVTVTSAPPGAQATTPSMLVEEQELTERREKCQMRRPEAEAHHKDLAAMEAEEAREGTPLEEPPDLQDHQG